jgi:hypothetical protein
MDWFIGGIMLLGLMVLSLERFSWPTTLAPELYLWNMEFSRGLLKTLVFAV